MRRRTPTREAGGGVRSARRVAMAFGFLVAVVGIVGLRSPASAQSETSFDAQAAAYGFDSTAPNPSVPFGIVPQAAGPTAQAQLSSLPQGRAFASYPYPGDAVVGLPGAFGAFVPGTPPLPAYPFYASSQLGSDPQEVNQPGVGLRAECTPTLVQSRAVTGSDGNGYVASARVESEPSGVVTATAVADLNAVSIGEVAFIEGVHSTAIARLGVDGELTFASSLVIGRISVPGLRLTIPTESPDSIPIPNPVSGLPQPPPVTLPPTPIPLGGTTLEAPDIGFRDGQFTVALPLLGNNEFAIPAEAALAAFRAAGLEVTYQAAQQTETTVVAPVLTLQTVVPAPPGNAYFSGATDVLVALGRSTASISSAQMEMAFDQPAFDQPAFEPPPADLGGGATPALTPADVAAPQPSSGAATAPTAASDEGGFLTRLLRADLLNIYLVLVGAALIGTFSAQGFRVLGVQGR